VGCSSTGQESSTVGRDGPTLGVRGGTASAGRAGSAGAVRPVGLLVPTAGAPTPAVQDESIVAVVAVLDIRELGRHGATPWHYGRRCAEYCHIKQFLSTFACFLFVFRAQG